MGKVIADLAASAASATLSVENATSSVNYVLSKTDGSANDHLKTDGSGNLSWVAPPAGGLTTASQWRVQADFTGDAHPIGASTGTIAIVNTDGYGSLGSAMTYGSGVFAFPSTGFWLCLGQFTFTTTLNAEVGAYLEYTANNGGAWSTASWSEDGSNYGYRSNINIYHMMDITDAANQKVRWSVDGDTAGSGGVVTTRGDTSVTETGFTFIKLADT